jgi:PmbA protein
MDQALTALAEAALEHARQRGAQQVAVSIHRARFIEVKRRDRHVETLQSSTSRNLSVALYVDGRYSSNSTSLLRADDVRAFIDETLAMTRALAPDPHRALPDPALYGPTPDVALELEDPGYDGWDMPWRLDQVAAVEEEALDDAAVISATATLVTQKGESLRLHSNGFRGERRGTSVHLGATVTARDADGRRPEEHWSVAARHGADLSTAAAVGREARRRALARVGGRKASSGRATLIVENRAASRLVSALLEPLTGAALQQRRSCFEGRDGQPIAAASLTLVDDPLIVRGLGSRTYDDEGLRAGRLPLISEGRLESFLIDVYHGRKLERPPTTGSTSNLLLELGTRTLPELLADAGGGFFVTSFLGGNSNPATGDFSFGVNGFELAAGEIGAPISEMNITGNLTSLWRELQAVGSDPHLWSAWRIPSLVFAGVQFSGR